MQLKQRFPQSWNTAKALEALDTYIWRHSEWLALTTRSWYIDAKGRKDGQFVKAVRRDMVLRNTSFDSPLEAALAYAKAGLPVLPLYNPRKDSRCSCRNGASCTSKGKHPRTRKGVYDATIDEATIREWLKKWRQANIGIATGVDSGLVVLDVDPRNSQDESLDTLVASYGPLPETLKVETGGGGWHYYFAYPTDVVSAESRGSIAGLPGFEIKSDGGYVVAPPSLHESDQKYTWVPSVQQPALADLPKWLLGRAVSEGHRADDLPQVPIEEIEAKGVAQGQRDDAAIRLVGHWVSGGITGPEELMGRLLSWNRLNHPLMGEADGDRDPEQWAHEKIRSVLRMEEQNHPERFQQRADQDQED